ncbi:MAG TPA: ABC transporter permease [Acidimicrobiales bacterium]|nr:ABC transporter permease [Acidimicrobiales bacterium]
MTTASLPARRPRWRSAFVLHDWGGRVGAVLLFAVVGVAILGPAFAPHPSTATIGIPGVGPGPGYPLGLDFLGRDVLSRTLDGGRSTLLLGGSATLLTYIVGTNVGLAAGHKPSWIDPLLMRSVDVVLSFPALLIMLLAVTAFGGSPFVLVCATALVLFPGVARIVRTATAEVATRAYVEAAVVRGERSFAIIRREILPNVAGPIIADLGIRFSWSIILIASVNYLGLGLKPPTADWGLMVSENRSIISSNPWAVMAPALMLALLIVAVNLVGDAYVRQLGHSRGTP